MNKWVGIGRLTRDPELRYTQSGVAITAFTVAVDRRFKNAQGEKETDFIQVKVFKKLAELCADYLAKGKLAGVTGELQVSSYTDKDGNKRWSTEIIADDVDFLSPKSEGTGEQNQNAGTQQQPPYGAPPMGQTPYPGQYAPPGYAPQGQPPAPGYQQAPPGSMPPPTSYQGQPPTGQGRPAPDPRTYGNPAPPSINDDIPF